MQKLQAYQPKAQTLGLQKYFFGLEFKLLPASNYIMF